MQSADAKPPFYESRWFKGTVAVVGLLTAVFAFGGFPKPRQILHDLTAAAELPRINTEIVLDRSRAMRKSFGGGTKLEAATEAVGKFAASTVDSGLGLRVTGGGCYGDGEVMVGPGPDHDDDVRKAIARMHAGGPSNVVGTVRRAIDEFTQDRFHRKGSTRRIVVFMGGEDRCAEEAGEEVRDALKGSGVETTFRMYALGLSKREAVSMIRFQAALHRVARVEYWPVENRKELDKAVTEEAEEIEEGKVPASPPRSVQAEVEKEASSILGGEVEEAKGEEETTSEAEEEVEETEATEETEESESTEEETTETTEETESTESSSPGADALKRVRLYASSRTGSVFSWLRKADSANFGSPPRVMFG
jgi:hypothetical protein